MNQKLSVIVPFKNKAKMTLKAVSSFLEYGPPAHEILLISNNSDPSELSTVNKTIKQYSNVKVLEYNLPFNYQKLNNWAVSKSTGNLIMFLNNETELTKNSTNLIKDMVAKALQKDVGITGCTLLYGDKKTIQHAGVFLQPKGMADHLYVGKLYKRVLEYGGKTKEYPYSIIKDRPMTAVTGAVNIIEKTKFLEVGGYDERFEVCGGDVDLSIRLNKHGYQTWFVSGGYIIHKESQSRAHRPVSYNDFYYSYLSYINGYDENVGDPFLPKITKEMK